MSTLANFLSSQHSMKVVKDVVCRYVFLFLFHLTKLALKCMKVRVISFEQMSVAEFRGE